MADNWSLSGTQQNSIRLPLCFGDFLVGLRAFTYKQTIYDGVPFHSKMAHLELRVRTFFGYVCILQRFIQHLDEYPACVEQIHTVSFHFRGLGYK